MTDINLQIGACYQLLQEGAFEAAFTESEGLFKANPDNVQLLVAYGAACLLTRREEKSNECLAAIDNMSLDVALSILDYWANLLARFLVYDTAIQMVQPIIDNAPEDIPARLLMSELLINDGKPELAREHIAQALQLDPANSSALTLKSQLEIAQGDLEAAGSSAHLALKADPLAIRALVNLVDLADGDLSEFDGLDIDAVTALKNDQATPAATQANIAYCLARIAEAAGDNHAAFDLHIFQNEQLKQVFAEHGQIFDPDAHRKEIGLLMDVFGSDFMVDSEVGSDIEQPIFIIGMPRSGTSLMERILSPHSTVRSIGESSMLDYFNRHILSVVAAKGVAAARTEIANKLPEWRASYLSQGQGGRLLDKAPHNLRALGLARVLFPDAAVVHIHRNPMATGFSIYRQILSHAYPYAVDQAWIGSFYSDYCRLMEHWKSLGWSQYIDVSYEDLVTDPQAQISLVLRSCGLTEEDACFVPEKSKGTVLTRSAIAVRRPIHQQAIETWLSYEACLAPLREALDADAGVACD